MLRFVELALAWQRVGNSLRCMCAGFNSPNEQEEYTVRHAEVHYAASCEPQFYEAWSNRTNCFLSEFV